MKTIVVIGAGRSGSTLLSRVLDAHPRVSFHGETDFLVPRLWHELWQNRFWLHWKLHTESGASSAISRADQQSFLDLRGEIDREVAGELVAAAREKAARAVRQTIEGLFSVAAKNPLAWGFKEPWNGSDSFRYDWTPYDEVFPDAIWVHLVRDPFAHARSVAQWNKAELNPRTLTHVLGQWLDVVSHSRGRRSTGRFIEIRFEDLLRSPAACLRPIFEASDVAWDDRCLEPLRTPVMQSRSGAAPAENADLTPARMQEACASVSGLAELCRELGYDTARSVPGYFRVETAPTRPSSWVAPQPNRAASSLATQAALTQCQGELRSAHKELQVARALLHRYESSRFIQLAMRLKALGRGSPAATGAGPKGVR